MEPLLGDTPQQHHPPCRRRRLLYLGVDCWPQEYFSKPFLPGGFDDVVIRFPLESATRAHKELRTQRWRLAHRSPSPTTVRDWLQ